MRDCRGWSDRLDYAERYVRLRRDRVNTTPGTHSIHSSASHASKPTSGAVGESEFQTRSGLIPSSSIRTVRSVLLTEASSVSAPSLRTANVSDCSMRGVNFSRSAGVMLSASNLRTSSRYRRNIAAGRRCRTIFNSSASRREGSSTGGVKRNRRTRRATFSKSTGFSLGSASRISCAVKSVLDAVAIASFNPRPTGRSTAIVVPQGTRFSETRLVSILGRALSRP
jgi:hypothetical protein